MVDVGFYNRDKNKKSQISVDELQAEYNSYINGGEVDILKKFVNCNDFDMGGDYDGYLGAIHHELRHILEGILANG